MCLGLCPCLPCHLSSLVTKGSDAASVLPAHAGSVLSIKALALCCLLAPKRRCNKGIFLRQAPAQTGCVERGDCKQQKAEHLLVCVCYSSCTCTGGTCKQCFLRGFFAPPVLVPKQIEQAVVSSVSTVWKGAVWAHFLLSHSVLPCVTQVLHVAVEELHSGAVGPLYSTS